LQVESLGSIFYLLKLVEIRGEKVLDGGGINELIPLIEALEGVLLDINVCLRVKR
jgi:hypothetical protein